MAWTSLARQITLLTAVLLLTGCASLLSGGLPLLKIAPAMLGERTLEQRLTMRWPGETRTLDVVADIDAQRVSLVGMALGVRLFSIAYDGEHVEKTEHVPMSLPAERMVDDFLIVHAPADSLAQALPAGWTLVDETQRRTLSRDNEPVIVVDYSGLERWSGRATLANRPLHYQLIIDSSVSP